jgi:hypothetical protein
MNHCILAAKHVPTPPLPSWERTGDRGRASTTQWASNAPHDNQRIAA